jgi:hypothetical protein
VTRVLEQAYRLGAKPVTPAIVGKALAPDMHDLEPTLTRYGYNIPAVSELLNIRQAEVRGFLHGQLPPGRTEELHQPLLAVGIPLGERLGVAEKAAVIGRDGQAAVGEKRPTTMRAQLAFLAMTPFALRVGLPSCLQAVGMKALAHSPGGLARR